MPAPDSIVPVQTDVLKLIHASFGKDGAPKPFAKEILLIECTVAGTTHVPVKDIEPDLTPGSVLILQREPANPHDPLAIRIHDEKGRKIGYVPRAKNEVLARLMDAGKLLFGKLVAKEWRDNWLRIEARIHMRDLA